jgi:hypothetical protein
MVGRLFLLGMNVDGSGVEVKHHPLGRAARRSRPARRRPAARIPASSSSPSESTSSRAVNTDATAPNNAACPASA